MADRPAQGASPIWKCISVLKLLVILGILTAFTGCYYEVLKRKQKETPLEKIYDAVWMRVFFVIYISFLLMSIWAMFTTIWVGPGYAEDHFASEKLDPLQVKQTVDYNRSPRNSFRLSVTKMPRMSLDEGLVNISEKADDELSFRS